ncbi:unnamed protein product, partial [Tilletia controversa]
VIPGNPRKHWEVIDIAGSKFNRAGEAELVVM